MQLARVLVCSVGTLAFGLFAGEPAAEPSTAPATPAAPAVTAPAATSDAAKETAPLTDMVVDTRESPAMEQWAQGAKETTLKALPLIMEILGEEGHKIPARVHLIVKPMKGVAHAAGNKIVCAQDWFQKRPEDVGAVVHEMCHVVQGYGYGKTPIWVVEGIADYVRWFRWEPENKRPRGNKSKGKYTDSYQTTAHFFDWIMKNKSKDFISKLNSICRAGKYKPEAFKEITGADVDALWAEYAKS